MQMRTWLCAAATFLALSGVVRADITGKVKFDGKVPELKQLEMSGVPDCAKLHADPVYDDTVVVGDNGELANVVVSIKTDDPSALGGEVPKEAAVLDQQGCMYNPHVMAVMVGQPIKIKSSDPFLHNVHALPQKNPAFNFGQPNKDPGRAVEPMKVEETFRVKCDVHPWMGMWMLVFEHPFFAVTGEDGSFTIPGELPDDEYTLTAWHEKYGTQEVKVTVKDGKGELAEPITFKDSGAMVEPVNKDVRLASLTSEGKSEGCSGCCSSGEKASNKTGTMSADAGTTATAGK